MAVPTNTVQTFAQNRNREDLNNTINLLDAYETPFYSSIGASDTGNRSPEWLTHVAPSVDPTNAVIEGDDVVNDTTTQTTRYKNYVQLMDKVYGVSTTTTAVDSAGTKEAMRQKLLMGVALRTDVESFFTGAQASVVGAAGVAGKLGGAESYIATNISLGAAGAVGGFQTGTGLINAPTDGTQRAFTEALLKSVVLQAWTLGGKNLNVLVGGAQKQVVSGFAGITTKTSYITGSDMATVYGAADLYVSDFGKHKILPTRFMRNRTALVMDFSTWEKIWLQPINETPLARTGHSIRTMLACEVTLKCWNEKGNGKVADLT